jgi:hypothetical protein
MRVLSHAKHEPPSVSHAMIDVKSQVDLSQAESFMKTWARGSVRLIMHGDQTMLTSTDPSDVDLLLRFCGQDS